MKKVVESEGFVNLLYIETALRILLNLKYFRKLQLKNIYLFVI